MAKIILICLMLVVTGCSLIDKKENIVIAECPAPPTIERPVLDIDNLKDGDDAGTVIQAHRISIKKLMKWGIEQETILNGYKK